MKTHLLSVRTAVLICLGAVACVRSVDNTKVRCTTSDHCPSSYVCSSGQCVSRSTGTGGTFGVDASRSDATTTADARPDQTIGSDTTGARNDVAPSGSDADVAPAAPGAGGVAGVGAGGTSGAGGAVGAGGVPGAGGIAGSIGGFPGLGGIAAGGGTPGSGGTGGTGGAVGAGGRGGANGGVPGSGGVTGSGGTAATGGTASTGGIGSGGTGTGGVGSGGTGSGGTPCQPKLRDCTSTLDNDCNGTPDNQETTHCVCPVGTTQDCGSHLGLDGTGICKHGTQTCAASADKTTSAWGGCSGSIGPSTRDCTSSADNDCNGTADKQELSYCQCTSGNTQSCTQTGACSAGHQSCSISADKSTAAWGECTGGTPPSVMYRDADGDNHGDPNHSAQVCSGTTGYVTSHDDCDDGDKTFYPGVSSCVDAYTSRTCSSAGVGSRTNCDYGCAGAGQCHPASDQTVGVPGRVSCTNVTNCLAADGCRMDDLSGNCGTAGTGSSVVVFCDGPNDCPGQECVMTYDIGGDQVSCQASVPSGASLICDPFATTCPAGTVCNKQGRYPFYACE